MKVVFSLEVENYFFELIEILHKKEYFGFKESATKYVQELIKDIQRELETSPKNLPLHILINMDVIYITHHSGEISLLNGLYSSPHTQIMEKTYT